MKFKEHLVQLNENPLTWLVTGAAGFIGSNLTLFLLKNRQRVIGLDNFSSGLRQNIGYIQKNLPESLFQNFQFVEGDITNLPLCEELASQSDYVLHQAAVGSVPRSIEDPITSHTSNVTGFINILWATQKSKKTRRIVYASSSSVYGDSEKLPKREEDLGNPLSPYAATKFIDEIYASVFARTYGIETVGLRYFNVFGPLQRIDGPYAAVIPKWVGALMQGQQVEIFGDGETSRDFCYIENVIQMNILSALTQNQSALNQAYNVAVGDRTTLNKLYSDIADSLRHHNPDMKLPDPIYKDFRPGDIRHSQADISKAKNLLGYQPTHTFTQGLSESIQWYLESHSLTEGIAR